MAGENPRGLCVDTFDCAVAFCTVLPVALLPVGKCLLLCLTMKRVTCCAPWLQQTWCLLVGTQTTTTSFSFSMNDNNNSWIKWMTARGLTTERIMEITIILVASWFIIAGCRSNFFVALV